jgi:pimeloyl-ACP methyl ester carboxylesterase
MMPRKHHKKSRDFFIRESVKMRSAAFRQWLTELFRTQFKLKDYIASLKESKLPVMFISGNEDYFFVKSVKKTHEKISEASMYFLEKCGHVCSIEKYREFNGLVLGFLHGC